MSTYNSNQIKLLSNNYEQGHKVLTSIIGQLKTCETFIFSVAFITNGGIATIVNELNAFSKQNKKGIIITSNYLSFNEPSVFRRLKDFDNIELRVIDDHNFHIKGYIFKNSTKNEYIIGSSNLTQEALTSNLEWNLHFIGYSGEEIVNEIEEEIDYLLRISKLVDDEWILNYRSQYKKKEVINYTKPKVLVPNKLQTKGLYALQLQRELKHNKALVISATGTGKTYLAAFDSRNMDPKRLLFVVHREQIAKKSMISFMDVFDNERTFGLYTGNKQQVNADFLFATIQTLSKDEHLYKFDQEYFDYIIYDEAHHIGAQSYRKVLDYFKPKFSLAMTATPERNDDNNIYEYMDHNIAFEIRLNEALKEDMLAPFHYYGVSDLFVDGKLIDDQTKFSHLISKQRVEHIIEKTELYGFCGDRVKGLMFCSRIKEAKKLCEELNNNGFNTVVLSGSNTQFEREDAIDRLTSDYTLDPIDYILTVDVFNEGVDIPEINQIVMLRPTQSAIVFVQQLGRGLRKIPNKEYVVIIDFIGNYNNNFFIPIALSGDRTLDKETLSKFIKQGNHNIPGQSTIHFDNVVEEKLLESVRQTNFATKKFLKDAYNDLKFKLGKSPLLLDFYELGSVDPRIIIQYKDTYYDFLSAIDKDTQVYVTEIQNQMLKFLSKEILYSKRIDEIIILTELIKKNRIEVNNFIELNKLSKKQFEHALNVLSLKFYRDADQQKYGGSSFIRKVNDNIFLSDEFEQELNNEIFSSLVNDVLVTSKNIIENEYISESKNPFVLYKKYTRKDACKLLAWEKDVSSTIYGYTVKNDATPIFVTYKKDDEIEESQKYNDKIIDKNRFIWYTRNKVTERSKEVVQLKNYKETNMKIELFIKKDSNEKDFYYVGEVIPENFTQEKIINDNNDELPIVKIDMRLKDELRDDIIDYFVD